MQQLSNCFNRIIHLSSKRYSHLGTHLSSERYSHLGTHLPTKRYSHCDTYQGSHQSHYRYFLYTAFNQFTFMEEIINFDDWINPKLVLQNNIISSSEIKVCESQYIFITMNFLNILNHEYCNNCQISFSKLLKSKVKTLITYTTPLTDGWICSLPLGKTYYICGKWSFLRHRFFRFAHNLSFEILAFFY